MSAIQSKLYRIETHLGEIHQCINDTVDSRIGGHNGRDEIPLERLTAIENLIGRLSISRRGNGSLHGNKLANVLAESRDHLRASSDASLDSALNPDQLSGLSQLATAKACIQTVAAALEVFCDNVIRIDEEIRYWEDVLGFNWGVGLHTLQNSPFKAWQTCVKHRFLDTKGAVSPQTSNDPGETPSSSAPWLQFYTSVQRCIAPVLSPSRAGILPTLSRSKLDIQRKKKKLQGLRDLNASAIGLLIQECMPLESDNRIFDSDKIADYGLLQSVQSSIGLLKYTLRDVGHDIDLSNQTNSFVKNGDNNYFVAQGNAGVDSHHPQVAIQELIHIITDLLPKYKQTSKARITESGRPSVAVRYWIPLSLALLTGTTFLKIARDVGPVVLESISNLGATAIDFWNNWVVDPMRKLVRTIRHDEKSEIALMSKTSLEADRASLERMVVDFVLDRGEQNQPNSSADIIVDRVREGDLTPVLRAYEKDLRSPVVGTVRGDLVRALLIQIQKTKVDVEVAMSGIDALLKSQELVFGFVGLTPGILISYASVRWFFGLLGSRRGFRLGRRQDDLRYALRKIHRILSSAILTEDGRLTFRDHGLLICNAEILLSKGQMMLKGEDLRAFREDSWDLINESRANKQLEIVERMAWTYSKWT